MEHPDFPPFHHRLLLASKSPRRQQLLQEAGFRFRLLPADIPEDFPSEMNIREVAPYLAEKKARVTGFDKLAAGEILLTADSTVCFGDILLNKPADSVEAALMLRLLSGNTHEVITGVCLSKPGKYIVFSQLTQVTFHEMQEETIQYYVSRYNPIDKAGSYGIQDWIGLCRIANITGDYSNVMGLPIPALYEAMLQHF